MSSGRVSTATSATAIEIGRHSEAELIMGLARDAVAGCISWERKHGPIARRETEHHPDRLR
jgi:hypothetical protein